MIIEDLKDVYVIKCSSNSEAKSVERMHRNDTHMCYGFNWTLEYYGPQVFNEKVCFMYIVPKETLLATESECGKRSQIGSFINHILYFQNNRA